MKLYVLVFLALMCSGLSFADTVEVDHGSSIQTAIDGGGATRTINLTAGTHDDDTWLHIDATQNGKTVIVQSLSGDPADTTIQVSHANLGFPCLTDASGATLTYKDLTLTTTDGSNYSVNAMVANSGTGGTSLTLDNCRITHAGEASAATVGGTSSNPKTITITDCVITHGGTGSVIRLEDVTTTTLSGNTLTGNSGSAAILLVDTCATFTMTGDDLTTEGIGVQIPIASTVTNLTISGSTIQAGDSGGNGAPCFDQAGIGTNIIISGNALTTVGAKVVDKGVISTQIASAGTSIVVRDNTIVADNFHGVWIPHFYDFVLIEDNTCTSAAVAGAGGVRYTVGDEGALPNANPLGFVMIRNNSGTYTGTVVSHCYLIAAGADGAQVYNNYAEGGDIQYVIKSDDVMFLSNVANTKKGVLIKGGLRSRIENNTVYATDDYCFRLSDEATQDPMNAVVLRNIFYASGAIDCVETNAFNNDYNANFDFNCYFTGGNYSDFGTQTSATMAAHITKLDSITSYYGTSQEDNGIDADPLFVDASSDLFDLLHDSPCINSGGPAGDTGLKSIGRFQRISILKSQGQ